MPPLALSLCRALWRSVGTRGERRGPPLGSPILVKQSRRNHDASMIELASHHASMALSPLCARSGRPARLKASTHGGAAEAPLGGGEGGGKVWAGGRRKRPFRAVLLGRQLARYWRLSRAGRRCRRRCRWSHGRLLVVALCAERRLRHRIARCCQTCVRSL